MTATTTPSPCKVLLIAPQPFFQNRGTPINVRAMAAALAELGLAVDLLVFPIGTNISIPGVTIYRCPNPFRISAIPVGPSWRKILLDIFISIKALQLCASTKYSVIQGVEEGGFVAWILGELFRIPAVFDMDSCMVSQLQQSGFVKSKILLKMLAKFEATAIRNSTAVITVCRALTDKVLQFAPDSKIAQIEDFPIEGLDQIDSQLAERLQLEFNPQLRPIVLYTGNFESYQGIPLLLDAFALTLRSHIRAKPPLLLLVGGNEIGRSNVQKQIVDLKLQEHVVLTGPRPESEMGAFMTLAEVLASPRLHGTNTPLKLYSYMVMGKPIVATDITSHTQVLNRDSAYLAAPNPNALAKALAASLDISDSGLIRRAKITETAQNLVKSSYSKECFVQKLRTLYTDILGSLKMSDAG